MLRCNGATNMPCQEGENNMCRNEKQIAVYSRKSKFTGKGESIGNQVDLCKEYVRNVFGEEYMGRCVIFEDEGFSGGDRKSTRLNSSHG